MIRLLGVLFTVLLIASCECTKDDQWVSLMDESFWKGYLMDEVPAHWVFKDGELICSELENKSQIDIITRDSYENFVLELQWNIEPKGNSGIFYHLVEDQKYDGPYQTAPEYQLIDDIGFPSPIENWQKTAANYAMHPPYKLDLFKGAGKWNTSRISYDHGKVQHWLNGELVVEFDQNSKQWETLKNSGKWKDYPDYKISNSGPIGLQDHGVGIRFKDIRIKRLE
jgi:hypothetical protein